MTEVINRIKERISETLGDDILDLNVAAGRNGTFNGESLYIKVVGRVLTTNIIIIKPASRIDMIKAAMPVWIRRVFPPKTVEVNHTIGLPALKEYKKSKIAVIIHHTEEIEENPDLLVDWCVHGAADELHRLYTNKTFRGW